MRFNDMELLKAVKEMKAGNNDAFDKIYRLTYKKVYFLSLSISKDEDLTNDIIQEVYISVAKNISYLKNDIFFISWLNKITYNTTIKELKKKSKIGIPCSDEDLHSNLVNVEDPLVKYLEDEGARDIVINIMELKEKYRTVFILKYLNNYKIKEISKIVGCPEGTVKSRLNSAKKVLKKKLINKYPRIGGIIFFSVIISSTLITTANAVVKDKDIPNIKDKVKLYHISKLIRSIIVVGITSYLGANIFINSQEKRIFIDDYLKSLTNNNIEIRGFVSNLSKTDKIQVLNNNMYLNINNNENGKFSFYATENGQYEIIVNDSEIKEIIKIENIDKEDPIIKEYNIIGEQLKLVLDDNLGGINYDKLRIYTDDNNHIEPVSIKYEENSIYLDLIDKALNIEIEDNAKNIALFKVEINLKID